jgi:tetratricopeptide (TPR) repeat protein
MKRDERRSRFGAISLVLFLSIATSACSSCDENKPAPPPSAEAASPPPATSSLSQRPSTTSPEIALNNLNGNIVQRLASVDRARPKDKLALVDLLLDRSHYLGKIADLEQAERIAAGMKDNDGGDGSSETHLARAVVANALHRFDTALQELDLATQAGAPVLRVHGTRASVFMARGRYDEALALQLPDIEQRSSLTIASAAVLACKMQKPTAEWERLFELARDRFADVSPFALAWMDFQRGTLFELAGDDKSARLWFAEAVDVLPLYAHAVVHLAPSESPADGIEMLEKVRGESDDPEVVAALAKAQQRAGHADAARPLIEAAKKRYDEIVAKYPEAFADHAARFWLDLGNDPKKALELARLNAKNRGTEEALDLWMAAGAGAKSQEDVCLAVHGMRALEYLSTRGKTMVSASGAKCPD